MSSVTIVKENGESEVFKDTIGHQIGNGAIQVMLGDGTQKIFNNFREVAIDLDDEEKSSFKKTIEAAEANARAKIEEQEKAEGVKLEAVPSH